MLPTSERLEGVRPLEYWKGKPKVDHRRRESPSYILNLGNSSENDMADSWQNQGSNMSKMEHNEGVHNYDAPFTSGNNHEVEPSRWNPRYWGKKAWIITALVIAAVIAIVVAVTVVEVKKNAYPNYSQLAYSKVATISGTSFFDSFDYFTGYDPTFGFVHYLLEEQQTEYNLTYAGATSAIVKVDNTQTNQTTGRYSVRLTSKAAYDTGLFIFDVVHTPYGCGTWPALWLTNANLVSWPDSGEIDVMEAVNQATTGNAMTLHSTDNCQMDVKRKETGTVSATNCYNGTDNNAGCGVQGDAATYGSALNAAGGAVMAMELRSAGIRMWQFARSSIPADVAAGTPDPSTWGTALADFPGTACDIPSHFNNQSIIIDIDLCGTWAGATSVYNTLDACPGTCEDYVANNPSAFDEAYWEFGSFTVYQASGA